jgi:ketosteroid isomerase-like protein
MSLITFGKSRPLALIFLIALAPLLQAQAFSRAEQEVWEREVKYWDFATTWKLEEYMALWDDDFVGWPAGNANPGGKAMIRKLSESAISNWQPGSFTVKLERLSVRIYGDVAAVFYRARYGVLDKAGNRIEGYVRVTHTWRRSAGVWKIIAGMSADEPNK